MTIFNMSERDTHEVLVGDMELHHIDMAAFVKEFNSMTETA